MHLSPLSTTRGVDLFPVTGSPRLHNSREHTCPNFLISISFNANPNSVCGSPIREFSTPGHWAIETKKVNITVKLQTCTLFTLAHILCESMFVTLFN